MLLFGSHLIGTPVMSLQTGRELARAHKPTIDPRTLSIVAYELNGHLLGKPASLLRVMDIREFSDIGMIVDSSDEFIELDDVIKIREIHDLNFELINVQVKDEKENKVGKVQDYTVEIGGFIIQQIIVKKPLVKSINESELTIHRSQITKITNDTIYIKSTERSPELQKSSERSYVNPFRSPSPPIEAQSE